MVSVALVNQRYTMYINPVSCFCLYNFFFSIPENYISVVGCVMKWLPEFGTVPKGAAS